jgi:hypothetical protein
MLQKEHNIMINKKHSTKLLLSALLLTMTNSIMSQLYVDSNTYIYNTNQVVYISQDLDLNAVSSFLYLRNEGQLLQGTTGSGANKGLGSLSVFQEGTVNNYAYNYWCSPVGNAASSTTENNPFGITQLGVPTTTTNTIAATMATNIYEGVSSLGALSIATNWIYKYLSSANYSDWISVGSISNINAGEGFTMKGTNGSDATVVDLVTNNVGSNQRYDFRGKPNDGTINISVATGMFTLTGNPYPSAIDLSAFLFSNTASIDGAAYFWEQDKTVNSHYLASYVGGYGTFSPISMTSNGIYVPAPFYKYDSSGNQIALPVATGNNFQRRFSPIGQGFMVYGMANAIIQMKNSFRVFVQEGAANFSKFEKKRGEKNNIESNFISAIPSISGFDYKTLDRLPVPQIQLNTITKTGLLLTMVLAFDPSATDAADFGMDATSSNEDLDEEVYFVIGSDSYVINTTSFNIDKKFPIGLRNSKDASFTINVNSVINLSAVENIYIHDKSNDSYQDIKNEVYTVTMPAGTNTSRFEITFKNGSLGIDDMSNQSNFLVRQDNTIKKLIISNPLQKEIASCGLYDFMGKIVFTKNQLGTDSSYMFSTLGLSDGFYIVKLTTMDKSEMGTKIIVKN